VEGCYTDSTCANGQKCLDNACVECITSAECFSKNQEMPICTSNVCGFCTDDSECISSLVLFETCHMETGDNGTQVIGRCVTDSYNKGFGVSAIVLGSLGVFGVIVAVALIGVSFATKAA